MSVCFSLNFPLNSHTIFIRPCVCVCVCVCFFPLHTHSLTHSRTHTIYIYMCVIFVVLSLVRKQRDSATSRTTWNAVLQQLWWVWTPNYEPHNLLVNLIPRDTSVPIRMVVFSSSCETQDTVIIRKSVSNIFVSTKDSYNCTTRTVCCGDSIR